MNDNIVITGSLKLKILKNGILIDTIIDANKIVDNGRDAICKLLGFNGPNKHITKVGVGTSSIATTTSDTTLVELFSKEVTNIVYPTKTSIKFIFAIDILDANNKSIREFGLISNDDTLFSRKVVTVIEKDETISILGEWLISFE